MNCFAIIAGAAIALLAVSVSLLVLVLPREEQGGILSSLPIDGHSLVQDPEKPRTNDGVTFQPDWN